MLVVAVVGVLALWLLPLLALLLSFTTYCLCIDVAVVVAVDEAPVTPATPPAA